MTNTTTLVVKYFYANGTIVVHNATQTIVTVRGVGNGTVTLTGKGGLSAGNQVEMQVTAYFAQNYFGSRTPNISFSPIGASEAASWLGIPQDKPETDRLGLPVDANITLKPSGNAWTGDDWVIYNQGGSYDSRMVINGMPFTVVGSIQIGAEDVTVTARTNALLVSLTWVIVAFSALELRKGRSEP